MTLGRVYSLHRCDRHGTEVEGALKQTIIPCPVKVIVLCPQQEMYACELHYAEYPRGEVVSCVASVLLVVTETLASSRQCFHVYSIESGFRIEGLGITVSMETLSPTSSWPHHAAAL